MMHGHQCTTIDRERERDKDLRKRRVILYSKDI